MVEIKQLTIFEEVTRRVLLSNFSFVLSKKDKIAIIGEEGNGKSTLLSFIKSPKNIGSYCQYTGEVSHHNENIGFLAQELTEVEKQMTISQLFEEVIWTQELVMAMGEFKIDSLISRQALGQFSGGEQFRYRFLRLLADDPDVLLLDEPTNDLDIQLIEWLEQFIKRIDLPVIYVSHDETFIRETANGIIHMEQRYNKQVAFHTISRSSYDEYVCERQQQLNKQEQVAKKQVADYQKQQSKWQDIWQKAENQHQNVARADPRLQKKIKSLKNQKQRLDRESASFEESPHVEEASAFHFEETAGVHQQKKILNLNLTELKKGERLLASQLELVVTGPEKIAIIGENGVGKTTLLKVIHQDLQRNPSLKVGYMPQNYEESLDDSQLPIDFLVESGEKEERTKAYTYLGSMNFTTEEMQHAIGSLSGGQKGKLLVLKMILEGCNVLVLDEPTRNFSPLTTPVLFEAFKNFRGAIISISHDRAYLAEVATAIYRLEVTGLHQIK